MRNKNLTCRVCGKIQDDPPWGEDDQSSTFNICDCCGVEFGYEDCNLETVYAFRKKWLLESNKWWNPKAQSKNWSLEEQMKKIRLCSENCAKRAIHS